MKAFLVCVCLLSSAVGVATASASEKVHVQASSDYRVGLIVGEKNNPNEKACQQALAASLGADMTARFGGRVNVRLVEVDSSRAASDLTAGSFDAVMVIGDALPATLRKTDFVATRGVSEVGVPVRVFQLVLRSDDPSMQSKVSASFQKALTAPRFIEALSRAATMKVTANNR